MTVAATTPDVGDAWDTALDHAASCPGCRAPGDGCETGKALVDAHQQARRAHHAEGTQ